MTTACAVTLGIALLCYFIATLLYQGAFLLRRNTWERWARKVLLAGTGVLAAGIGMHFLMAGLSPFSDVLVVVSLVVISLLVIGLLAERRTRVRNLSSMLAPMGFFGLLYPVLLPIRFAEAESILVQFPLLGLHVLVCLLGLVGFALACCTAVAYLVQVQFLKKGRLNSYLPALDAAASATYHFAAAGFSLFTLGLGMGLIWFFGAPGEYLGGSDLKIWMALPCWAVFALYLYLRGVDGQHGSRLKWLVIVGFLLSLFNLLGVRHNFDPNAASFGAGQGKEALVGYRSFFVEGFKNDEFVAAVLVDVEVADGGEKQGAGDAAVFLV